MLPKTLNMKHWAFYRLGVHMMSSWGFSEGRDGWWRSKRCWLLPPKTGPKSYTHQVSRPGFGAPRPGREHNHQVCWDQVSHRWWIMAQDRMSHLYYIIGVLYKINSYIIRRQRSSKPKLTGRRRPRPLMNTSQHPPSASSCGTCSWPVGVWDSKSELTYVHRSTSCGE